MSVSVRVPVSVAVAVSWVSSVSWSVSVCCWSKWVPGVAQEREDQRLPHMTCMHPPPQEREDQRLQTVAIYHELLRSCQARGLVAEATSYLEMVTPCSAEYELN